MRARLVVALASALLVGAACSDGDGATSGTITIYSGRSENLMQPLLDEFTADTGIEVRLRDGNSTDLALLIAEEGDRTEADVFLSRSPGPVGFLEGRGLLATLANDTLSLVDENNRASSGAWVGFSGRKRVLVYNIDKVDPADLPVSIFDLTDPRYEGRVAIPATNGSFEDWFTVFRFAHGDDVATRWLADMVDNGARFYANNRAIVEATGRGEIDMGLVNHYYNYQEAAARGDDHRGQNHDFSGDDLGSVLIITAATVLDSSDSKDLAEELISYLLSEKAQTFFANETFEYPLAAGVEPAVELAPLDGAVVGSIDFDRLGGGFEATERIIRESGILDQ